MDFNSLDIFVKVVQAGSFSGAARRFNISVATISRRVSELEKSVGVRLIDRSTRHLRITDTGITLYEYASRGFEEIVAGRLALEQRENELHGTLRVSIPPYFEPWREVTRKFNKAYPNITIEIFVTERKINLVEDGIDVALRIGDVIRPTVVVKSLGSYRHQLVASPKFLKRFGRPKRPEDLMGLPCTCWKSDSSAPTWTLGGKNFALKPYLQINDYKHLQYLTLKGDCITALPPFLAEAEIKKNSLVRLLQDYPMPDFQISLIYSSRKNLSRLVRTYLDFCASKIDWVTEQLN